MKTLFHELRTALLLTAFLAVLLGAVYPVLVWGAAQLLFPSAANGSLVRDPDGALRGSALLAQHFTGERYFHPRPSAAGAGYDAAASSGSNLGPTSRKLAEMVAAGVATYRTRHLLPTGTPVPADAVTRSSSGLDPHISPANAAVQSHRVARVRGLRPELIRTLIEQHTASPDWGVFGQARVNVFLLNRALDGLPR